MTFFKSPQMKKYRRVTRSEEFQDIIHKAAKKTSALYVVYYRPKKEEYNRIGIAVSKKSGHAVVRNRIKRQVRQIVDETGALETDQDMIIIVRRGYNPDNYAASKDALETLVKQVTINRSQYPEGEENGKNQT